MSYAASTPKPPFCHACGAEHFAHDACRPQPPPPGKVILWVNGERHVLDEKDITISVKPAKALAKKRSKKRSKR